jgi:hypothetical protein
VLTFLHQTLKVEDLTMPPIPVQSPRFQPKDEIMSLDNVELTLELLEFAQTTDLKDPRPAPAQASLSPDWLTELYSASSMIMDRAEIEAMANEIAVAHQPRHNVAA